MKTSLAEKVVVVTGSSIGIGAAIAEEFARHGAKVVITYNSHKAEAEKIKTNCERLGAPETFLSPLDVTSTKSIESLVEKVVEKFGQIDILVNNAGVFGEGTVETTTVEDIENQVRVNIEGLIKMTHFVLPHLKGAVINISSRAGLKPYPGYATYGTTKWAVRGFSQSLAEEISQPVYCVNPRGTATAMNDFEGDPPEKVAKVTLDVLTEKIKLPSGSDVNVWDY